MEYLPLTMIRENMSAAPKGGLPDGYSVRAFGEGDDATWVRVWRAAEPFLTIDAETFRHEFGDNLPAMTRRCLFLVAPDGSDVGTVTCWYERKYRGKPWGRIHWLAITPDHQGKGLAKPFMVEAMAQMAKLGHRRAMLGTQTPRLGAIKTYLNCGFKPDMTATDDAKRAWKLVKDAIGPHRNLKGFR